MSHEWDVYCQDCDSSLGLDGSYCPRLWLTRPLIRARHVLANLHEALREPDGTGVDFGVWAHSSRDFPLNLEWFAEHHRCRLTSRSDIGQIDEEPVPEWP